MNSNIDFHVIVSNSCISSFNFFYRVVECLTKICFTVVDSREFNFTFGIILNSFKNITFFIFQFKSKFFVLQLTSVKCLTKNQLDSSWNVVNTFFSWFVWFFNSLSSWVVVVYNLSCCIFNFSTIVSTVSNLSWDDKLVVTSKFELSSIDNLSVFCIAK